MAELDKHLDRESWLTWAIEFMRRGLWLDQEITVHGPHDSTRVMWGSAAARIDGQECGCRFRAYANRNKLSAFPRPHLERRRRGRNVSPGERVRPHCKGAKVAPGRPANEAKVRPRVGGFDV